jgi:hypothetical protein
MRAKDPPVSKNCKDCRQPFTTSKSSESRISLCTRCDCLRVYRKATETLKAERDKAQEAWAKTVERCDKLQEALGKYGEHNADCGARNDPPDFECKCGLDEVLGELDKG